MAGIFIFICVQCDKREPKLGACPHDPNGDLAPVRYQYFVALYAHDESTSPEIAF
jgi:hypothetical protein